MNILIINQHANNLGDEAAAIALIEELKSYSNIKKIYLNYIGKGKLRYNTSLVEHVTVRLRDIGVIQIAIKILFNKFKIPFSGSKQLQNISEIINAVDVIFVSPSGADLGHYRGWTALINLLFFKSYNKKIIFHLNSIDKCNNYFFEFWKRRALKGTNIYVREWKSKEYLTSIGFNSTFGIDTAFLLPPANSKQVKVISFVFSKYDFIYNKKERQIIDYNIKNYVLQPLVKFASENDYQIQVVPHLLIEEERLYLYELVSELNCMKNDISFYDQDVVDALTYQDELTKSVFVIGMRYHSIVLAAKNGIPFISISYDTKMDELTRYLRMEKYNNNLFGLDKVDIYNQMQELKLKRELIGKKILQEIDQLKNTARMPVEEYFEKLQEVEL